MLPGLGLILGRKTASVSLPIRKEVAMLRCRFSFIALLLVPLCAPAQPKAPYYPDAAWQRRTPAEAGIDAQRLKDAVAYAVANETRNPRDLTLNHYQTFGREPFGYAIGPIKDRGEQTGVVVLKGYIVAEWGEPLRVDMTHSVTKSLLSSVVVYVDPDHDVVAVLRWIERKAIDEFVKRLLAALPSGR